MNHMVDNGNFLPKRAGWHRRFQELSRALPPSWRRLALVLCACAMAIGAAGCKSTRTSEYGYVSATAVLRKGVPTYEQLEIRQPKGRLAPTVWLKLPDGRVIDRTWFDYYHLHQAGFYSAPDEEYQPANRYSQEFTRYGVSFCFFNGALEVLRISQTQGDQAAFSFDRGTNFFTMPLTQDQLDKLLGKPDKVSDGPKLD